RLVRERYGCEMARQPLRGPYGHDPRALARLRARLLVRRAHLRLNAAVATSGPPWSAANPAANSDEIIRDAGDARNAVFDACTAMAAPGGHTTHLHRLGMSA